MNEPFQLFERLDDATEAALVSSVRRHGVLVPVFLDQHDRILDGHQRARIADSLGRKYETITVDVRDDEHAREIARTLNTDRRHLTPERRREVVADLRMEGHSQTAIAGALGVSQSTVRDDLAELSTDTKFAPPGRVIGLDGISRPSSRPDPQRNAALYTSDEDDWHTPQDIIQRTIRTLGGIDLDPCSNLGLPNVEANRHFTVEDDGLAQEWAGTVYLNPPYGSVLPDWTDKLIDSYENGAVTSAVALVPSRTDTAWFRRLSPYLRCFIWGRLKFSGHDNSAPFPSMVVYFGSERDRFIQAFSPIGDVYGVVE